MPKSHPVLDKIAAVRPPMRVTEFFDAHHERLAEERAAWCGRAREFWATVAATFAADGIVNRFGRPSSAGALQRAWNIYVNKRSGSLRPASASYTLRGVTQLPDHAEPQFVGIGKPKGE